MLRPAAIVLLLLGADPRPVEAAQRLTDAESFLDVCASGGRDNAVFCASFFKGFFAGVFTSQALAKVGVRTCLPDHLPDTAAREAFLDYLTKHPQKAKGDLSNVAFEALRKAYPCASSN